MKRRLLNLLIALDQLLWVVITLGNGSPDETISAAVWRLEQEGRIQGKIFRPIIDTILSWFEKDHCKKSYESERYRKHLPPEYNKTT